MPAITPISNSSRSRYSCSLWPGATPALAIRSARPACARLRSSVASSLSPTEKRGKIGAWVRGRKAQRCAFRPRTQAPILPRFSVGDSDEATELRKRAQAGLALRIASAGVAPGHSEQEYRERLEFEIGVIAGMKYPGYFLIVADFIQWAKAKLIPVGPGRGSGAGSLVSYALTITDLDPIRFGLLFERFLNPERVSMPDFDIDFCQERRDEVIRY